MKHKKYKQVYPYTYLIIRKSDGHKYHGVRYANVNNNISPLDDLGINYFTSSKIINKDFKINSDNYFYRVAWTFDSVEEALDHEYKVNSKIFNRTDWINMTYGKNFGDSPDIGKLISQSKTKEVMDRTKESFSNFLKTEEGIKYRDSLSRRKRDYWANLSKEEKLKVLKNAHSKIDVALEKTNKLRKKVICEDTGDTYNHVICRKSADTRKKNNTDSLIGKKRNITYDLKLSNMSEPEFIEWCKGKTQRAINGAKTRRNRMLNL